MKANVYKIDGTKSGETIELPADVFEVEPKPYLIYHAVRTYLSNQRQGTHKTKERSEVRGGGRKPWRQKGRGTARAGTNRSPLWVGGGRVHGPRPHLWKLKMNKQTARLARKSALSLKAKAGEIMVIEDFDFQKPKTKDFTSVLSNLKVSDKKTLMLIQGGSSNVYKSARNIPGVRVCLASDVPTYDLVDNEMILIQKSAIEKLSKPLQA